MYRNNLVRTTLSVFVACTLLYTASASAQQTLTKLPTPTGDQISWTASETEITVHWENTAAGVSTYFINLEDLDGAFFLVPRLEIDASTMGSRVLPNVIPGRAYRLFVEALGDTSLYARSDSYFVEVVTNALAQPLTDEDILVGPLGGDFGRDIVVSWPAVTGATNYTVNLYLGNDRETSIRGPIETTDTTHTFRNLAFGTRYTAGVIADNAPNNEAFNSGETDRFTLRAPEGISLSVAINSITVRWTNLDDPTLNIESYLLSIDPDPAGAGEQTIPVSALRYIFHGLQAGSEYTVSVVSSRDETGYIQSSPYMAETVMTDKGIINPPTRNELVITPSTDNITVTFEHTQMGVEGYALSIHERFDDMGIAQSTEDSSIGESPITFTDLLPDRAYTLMALPTFESERYEYSGGTVSLDFMTRDTSLRLRLRVFLEGPLQ